MFLSQFPITEARNIPHLNCVLQVWPSPARHLMEMLLKLVEKSSIRQQVLASLSKSFQHSQVAFFTTSQRFAGFPTLQDGPGEQCFGPKIKSNASAKMAEWQYWHVPLWWLPNRLKCEEFAERQRRARRLRITKMPNATQMTSQLLDARVAVC